MFSSKACILLVMTLVIAMEVALVDVQAEETDLSHPAQRSESPAQKEVRLDEKRAFCGDGSLTCGDTSNSPGEIRVNEKRAFCGDGSLTCGDTSNSPGH